MASINPVAGPSAPEQFVLLHKKDNILVCVRPAMAGGTIVLDGNDYLLKQDVALGHKVARYPLATGDKVLRYGISIGSMTAPVEPGEHIHSHNLKSDYIPAHGRDAVRIREIRS